MSQPATSQTGRTLKDNALSRPWLVVRNVLPEPERLIESYGRELLDLSAHRSAGETRSVYGRQFEDEELNKAASKAFRDGTRLSGIQFDGTEAATILRYTAGGEYSWHADNELIGGERRKLGLVIALSEGHEGGGTEFMWPRPGVSETVHLRPGDGVVFPAFMYHRARLTVSGVRWVVVVVATGDPFR